MSIYLRSVLALAADAAFMVSVGCEALAELADEAGIYLAKRAGVPYTGHGRVWP